MGSMKNMAVGIHYVLGEYLRQTGFRIGSCRILRGSLPFTAYLPIIEKDFRLEAGRAMVMVVKCESCKTDFRLNEALLKGAKGACIRCPKCREPIIVKNPRPPQVAPPIGHRGCGARQNESTRACRTAGHPHRPGPAGCTPSRSAPDRKPPHRPAPPDGLRAFFVRLRGRPRCT
ncbi:MAG: hypothetical protein E4H01_14305 [Lysobacterales bacterium]|nr:MAG: hypothetical protein E4H01_14305 [Xanthomonadales bacterium]